MEEDVEWSATKKARRSQRKWGQKRQEAGPHLCVLQYAETRREIRVDYVHRMDVTNMNRISRSHNLNPNVARTCGKKALMSGLSRLQDGHPPTSAPSSPARTRMEESRKSGLKRGDGEKGDRW